MKNTLITMASTACLLAASGASLAQMAPAAANAGPTPPTSGAINQQNHSLPQLRRKADQPLDLAPQQAEVDAAQPAEGRKVRIETIQIDGAKSIAVSELLQNLNGDIGQEHDIFSLKNIAHAVTRQYREAGYLVARAYLPAQELDDGKLMIKVLEGSIDSVSASGDSRLKPSVATQYVESLSQDSALKSAQLERKLRLLNDLPGIEVDASLVPGDTVGTTKLRLNTKDSALFSGNVSADNLGNRYTRATRVGAVLAMNNASGFGERTTLRLATSGKGYQFAQLGLELPIGSNGLMASVNYSDSEYQLLKDFRDLDATGDSKAISASLSYPWIRSLGLNLYSQLSVSRSQHEDRNGVVGLISDREVDNVQLALYGDYLGEDSSLSKWQVSIHRGDMEDQQLASASDSYGIQGDFYKTKFNLSHERWLNDAWRFYVSAAAQLTGDNLVSSEKFTLGGPNGVRAYPQGEALVDQGGLLTTELRYQLNDQFMLAGFFDAAYGERFQDALPSDSNNLQKISGVGMSLNWAPEGGWFMSATLATRTDSEPNTDRDRTPRLWLQLVKQY